MRICRMGTLRHGGPVLALAILIVSAAPAAGQPGPPAALPPRLESWLDGLALLHSSRSDEALDWFLARHDRKPEDICGFYFPALVYTNFKLVDLDTDAQAERGFDLLEQGIKLGEKQMSREPDVATRYCVGGLHGLRAAERLKRSKYLRAALDGKRSRRIMLDLLEDEPELVDCRFWIGSYDYFADVLPAFFKFFRTLLFFPSGDKERGIAALDVVATDGRLDRYNSLWMLYSLYRGFEEDDAGARRSLERLRQAYPESIDVRLTLAWSPARETPPDYERVLELHRETVEYADSVAGRTGLYLANRARLSQANALDRALEPDAAVAALRARVDSVEDESLAFDAAELLVRSLDHAGRHAEIPATVARLRGRYPESSRIEQLDRLAATFDQTSSELFAALIPARRLARDGRQDEAQAEFAVAFEAYGERGLIYMAMAELAFEDGRDAAAVESYRAVLDSGDTMPAYLPGLAYLRLGNLADLDDRRSDAKSLYRKADDAAGELEWLEKGIREFLKRPYVR